MNISIKHLEQVIAHLKEKKVKSLDLRLVGGNDQWYEVRMDGYTISIPAATNDKGKVHTNRTVQEDL